MKTAPRIGILGGSFDPPHVGHVLLASYALTAGDIDELLVAPVWQHPWGKPLWAAYGHRVAMSLAAMKHLSPVQVSEIERELGDESWTFEMVTAVQERNPQARFRLVLGADTYAQRRSWQRFDLIEDKAPPLVIGRTGHLAEHVAEGHLPLDMPEVSSSDLRNRLLAGKSVEGLVPTAVGQYIETHGLYVRGSGAG